ncbi:MAG: PIN domain-containing protein [Limisphaerales bacterium]
MRIFLDANILFSGARRGSRLRALLDILMKHCECVTNAYAVEEARRNLELKDPTRLREFQALVKQCGLVTTLVTELPVTLESKDIPILGGAIAGKATHLLTGDARHFQRHYGKTIQGVKVVSPKMMADELVKRRLL